MNYNNEFYKHYNGEFAGDKLSTEIVRLSKKYIKGKVLDVGAGSGSLIGEIKKLNYVQYPLQQLPIEDVMGIDIVPSRDDIIKAGIDNIPFPDEHFDCVTCTATLEHLEDSVLTKGISEVYRVLKPRGYFIATVPYKEILGDNNESTILCPNCNKYFHRWGHVQSFDEFRLWHIVDKNLKLKLIKCKVLPLGFMATHKILRYFIPIIKNMPLVRYEQRSIFIVAKKI